jgi:phosphomevalonate kinase
MISGEYVVLDGAECLVAAVDRRLRVIGSAPASDGSPGSGAGSPQDPGLPPEALLARQYAEDSLGPTSMTLSLAAHALRSGDRTLGLGWSSAASAATAGAVVAWHGRDPAEHRAEVLDYALRGHRAVAPEGSGADVAAATLGGLVRYRREAPGEARSMPWPERTRTVVVWTGTPARTSDLVRAVNRLKADSPADYARAAAPLERAAAELLDALLDDAPARVVAGAGAPRRAMKALGEAAGVPIVNDSLERAMALAERHGGGAKPSGAGGGDVAIAFFSAAEDAARFEGACSDVGLTPLSLRLGVDGVRTET